MDSSYQTRIRSLPTDLCYALDKFDRDALKILEPLLSELEYRDLPPTIYHYTTDIGLRGILESGKLWLTDIFALNDPSELRHGYQLATSSLTNEVENGPEEYRQFANDFIGALEHEKEDREGIERSAHYFVCSFSKDGNDLGQWRAYADDGRGYALEFKTSCLEKAFTESSRTRTRANILASDGETFPVTYNDVQLSDIHKKLIQKSASIDVFAPREKSNAGCS